MKKEWKPEDVFGQRPATGMAGEDGGRLGRGKSPEDPRHGGRVEGAQRGGTKGAAEREDKEDSGPPVMLRMMDRDRQLMGMLAEVRYLAMEHLQRVLYAERSGINLHKRLLALAGIGKHGVPEPFLKRLSYRDWQGAAKSVWVLTALGYTVADAVLPKPAKRPAAEVGAAFIEHGLMLNELYVRLLEAPLKQALEEARLRAQQDADPKRAFVRLKSGLYARAAHPGFRWLSHDETRLPWKQYDSKKGKKYGRLIVPDATLEIPGVVTLTGREYIDRDDGKLKPAPVYEYAGRRFFLECETGSHSIASESDEKTGSTLAKLSRYESFINGYAGNPGHDDYSTHYSRQYPDNFLPYLFFLVRTESRAKSINAAIKAEQGRYPGDFKLKARALTLEDATTYLLKALDLVAPPAVPPAAVPAPQPAARRREKVLVSGEVRLIDGFFTEAIANHHLVRVDAKRRGVEMPPYPATREAMLALLEKLKKVG